MLHCNSNLETSKAPLKSETQSTSLFTSAASNQRGCPSCPPTHHVSSMVQLPEGQRRQSCC